MAFPISFLSAPRVINQICNYYLNNKLLLMQMYEPSRYTENEIIKFSFIYIQGQECCISCKIRGMVQLYKKRSQNVQTCSVSNIYQQITRKNRSRQNKNKEGNDTKVT